MSPLWSNVIGASIILMMLVFCAICIWAWQPRHKKTFDALARLPADDGGVPNQPGEDDRR